MAEQTKGNGNNPEMRITTPPASRVRASGPILFLAILFVVASFLSWYFTWFGRNLSDSEITKFLVDEKHPRHVQHALLQIQERIERGDKTAKQWYPQIIALSSNPEKEFRLTVAWLMGADNTSEDFHNALRRLLVDPETIVRRNAALALVRFSDSSGHAELIAILEPLTINAPATGLLASTLSSGAQVSRGSLLARIQEPNNEVTTVRSPFPGIVDRILVANSSRVSRGDPVMTIKSDEQSIWEALRALSIVGKKDDLSIIERYASGNSSVSDRIRRQAAMTAKSIQRQAQ